MTDSDSFVRQHLIDAGVLRERPPEPPPATPYRPSSGAVLRLDAAGRREAERVIRERHHYRGREDRP